MWRVSAQPPPGVRSRGAARLALMGVGVLALGLSCVRRVPEDARVETTVYVARRIRTLDAERPEARALAVRQGRLVAVGSEREVREAAGDSARVVDLGDAVVVPGLVDAHAHLSGLGLSLTAARLEGARSVDEAIQRLVSAPATSFQGGWLGGEGGGQKGWGGGGFRGRAELDARFPTTPVYLTRVDHHAAWVNGEALRRSGITRDTPDPSGGRILRDAKGEPTGVLVDNAMDLVSRQVPPPTDEQLQMRLSAALERGARVGLTGGHGGGRRGGWSWAGSGCCRGGTSRVGCRCGCTRWRTGRGRSGTRTWSWGPTAGGPRGGKPVNHSFIGRPAPPA